MTMLRGDFCIRENKSIKIQLIFQKIGKKNTLEMHLLWNISTPLSL